MTDTDPAEARRRTADGRSVIIIGGGFCGTMLAVHLLRRAGPDDRVTIIEPRARLGHGLAYGATDPDHLLNVRARGMSAYPDDPDHFVRWLDGQPPGVAPAEPADAFLPRALYGAYVEAQIAPLRGPALRHVRHRAVAADPTPDGVAVRLDDGTMLAADVLVLAFGNLPPQPDAGPYRGDPWAEAALVGLDSRAPVLILGTGLTMVDVAIALDNRGHTGPIRAVSRRGLVPRIHAPAGAAFDPAPILAARPRLGPLLRALRAAIRDSGRDWRAVMDALRPHLPALWHGLSDGDRRAFLRHLRPWWDVHRHRLPPAAASRLAALQADGRLRITAGRVLRSDADPAGAEIALQPRGTERVELLRVDRVIDCTGPRTRLAGVADPLIGQILAAGHARPDPLELGLDTGSAGAVTGGGGAATPGFWALGPMTRPRDWEITAVPELRVQAAVLAAHLWPERITPG